jgi:hypothetical protein
MCCTSNLTPPTKRKGTPASRPPGILPCGYAIGLRGFADSASCAARTRAPPCARPCGPDAAPARRLAGAPLRGHRGRAEQQPAVPTPRLEDAPARGAAPQQRKRQGARIPCVAPSNAAADRGKARMFERMDARARPLRDYVSLSLERAGRSVASSAGHGARAASDARQSGRLLFGYFLLARQEKVTRGARTREGPWMALLWERGRAARKLLLRLLNSDDNTNRSKTRHPGRGHGPLLHQQFAHQRRCETMQHRPRAILT